LTAFGFALLQNKLIDARFPELFQRYHG
jgi:hypothetical protein